MILGGYPKAVFLSIVSGFFRGLSSPARTSMHTIVIYHLSLIISLHIWCNTSTDLPTKTDAEEEWINYKSLQDTVLHIDLRNWADICLIAPLSAHTLAKIANGLCDDLLTCCMRAWDFGQRQSLNGDNDGRRGKPVILAPAMNTVMWDHPLTRMQLETIQHFFTGVEKTVVGDDNGEFTPIPIKIKISRVA